MENQRLVYLLLFLIIIIASAIRLYPFFLGSLGAEPDSFYHARMAQLFVDKKGLPSYDSLSMQGRPYTYSPIFHLSLGFLSISSGIKPIDLVALYPAFYSIAAALLVFLLAKRLFKSWKAALISCLAFATMNLHLARTSSSSRPDALALTIIIAAIFLLLERKMLMFAFFCVFLALLHPLSCLYFFSFVVLAAIIHTLMKNSFPCKQALLSVALGTAIFAIWLFSLQLPLENYLSKTSLESSEMQNTSFIAFFAFFMFSWPFFTYAAAKAKTSLFEKLWLFYSFLFGIFAIRLFFYFAPVAALFTGLGFSIFLEKIGKYKALFFAILFILLSSSIAYFLLGFKEYPSQSNEAAFAWIKGNTPDCSTIASIWDNGHLITELAARKAFVDGYFEFAPQLAERNNAFFDMAYSSDCNTISSISSFWKINYLFIPDYAADSRNYRKGILEAINCQSMDLIFDNGAKLIKFNSQAR